MSKLLSLVNLKWLLAIGIVLGALAYWVNWSLDMNTQVADQKTAITDRDGTIAGLRTEIETYTSTKKQNKMWFDELEEAQIDLMCAARNGTPISPPPATTPQIVEVVKYRDRVSNCPTTDISKAEVFDPKVSELRPVNDEIALQALNNAWKAYCISIKNEDETCAPFK